MKAARLRPVSVALAVAAVLVAAVAMNPPTASAAMPNPALWDPGFIVSDEQFYDANSMTEAEIQAFLDARVPVCETWRTLGPSDPIICLKDFTMTTQTMTVDQFCPVEYKGAVGERASTIIYKVAQACGISPKVILVTLDKETSLVSHTWPSQWRYTRAMGYGCPDTAPCIEAYGGLQKQIYLAAKQMKRYQANPQNYNYRAGRWNNIAYNPNPACGYSAVYIQNVATASLYNYTPYQPTATALANNSNSDGCSSYGNRNFWRYWWDWFGDPATGIPAGITVDRIGGDDRYAVAVGISQQYFPSGASTVYIATGDNFPDALSAAPAAARKDAPLLLVPGKSIPNAVAAELVRLAPSTIVVSGGSASVSDAVVNQLAQYAPTVVRMAGSDRYEVSRNITRDAFGGTGSNVAYVATGVTFPDALSASAAAGALDAPVILVQGAQLQLDPATAALIAELGVKDVRIAGGAASVSTGIENSLKAVSGVTSVTRVGGSDRFQVSGAINRAAFTSASTVFVANGMNFPDALSGAAVAGANGSPLYVIPSNCMPNYVANDIVNFGATKMTILGGPASVTGDVTVFTRCR